MICRKIIGSHQAKQAGLAVRQPNWFAGGMIVSDLPLEKDEPSDRSDAIRSCNFDRLLVRTTGINHEFVAILPLQPTEVGRQSFSNFETREGSPNRQGFTKGPRNVPHKGRIECGLSGSLILADRQFDSARGGDIVAGTSN